MEAGACPAEVTLKMDYKDRNLDDLVIPVSKSAGISTYDVIRKLKKAVKVEKVGHSGTLDPPATGLVLILTGSATKLSSYLMELPKRYRAVIKLGEATDTQDGDGKVIRQGGWQHVSREAIEEVLPSFTGKRMQTPPMYSALKHKGTPLYTLARKGREIEREPREVTTYDLRLTDVDLPLFGIEVYCSRGMYVRVLAEEIGDALGVPAHLESLERTEIGHFSIADALPDSELDKLAGMDRPGYSMAEALQHLPAVEISLQQSISLDNGIPPVIPGSHGASGRLLRLIRPGGALGAIAEIGEGGVVVLRKVFLSGGAVR